MSVLETEAASFEAFVAAIGRNEVRDLHRLADELGLRLRRFAQMAEAKGVPRVQTGPAQLALALIADQRVRAQRSVDLTIWAALARQALFEGREIGPHDIKRFHQIALEQGPEFAPLAGFLDHKLAVLGRRVGTPRKTYAGLAVALVMVIGLGGMLGYLGWLEHRYHAQVFGAYTAYRDTLDLDQGGQSSSVVSGLGLLSADRVHVAHAVMQSPLRGVVTLPFADAVARSDTVYEQTAGVAVGPLLADAIGLALATEGQPLALYDTLRAHGILSGQTAWEPLFLVGWIASRQEQYGLDGFADHVRVLTGPVQSLRPVDPLVLEQARVIAAETSEADRAWLEMLRAPDVVGLPPWQAAIAVPRLDQVALRPSGKPLEVPGLYTRTGWEVARDTAAGVAVTKSRALALPLFGDALPQENDTPDQVMARLQTETIAAWTAWLADLRVRSFEEPDRGIIVSGILSQHNSPLPALFHALWDQVGGNDRDRPRPLQTEIARAFGPAIQYVEQGRMDEVAGLFAAVNVALVTRDQNVSRGDLAIVSAAERARSIQSLRAAPRLVVLLVEDTLAQISAPKVSIENPMGRNWLRVQNACSTDLTGRYPFGEGAPITPAALSNLFGPQGLIPVFFTQYVAPNMEMSETPWRWKTEARFTGLSPESAAFFERAMAINDALYGETGFGATFTITALAERGRAELSLGGQTAPVRANGAPGRLTWPGPAPQNGVALAFGDAAASATLSRAGPWGLMQLLDTMRLRPRNDGARFLIDMRDDNGRVFLEMTFQDPFNPIALRPLMDGLTCPQEL